MIYRAPCKNFHGYALVRIMRQTHDLRGQLMLEVESLNGEPWSEYTMGGYCPTNRRSFYPEHLELDPELNEKAPEATETFSQKQYSLLPVS